MYGVRASHLDKIINDSHKTIMPDKDNDIERQVVEMSIQKRAPFLNLMKSTEWALKTKWQMRLSFLLPMSL
ncbi:hypothetical protein LJR015_002743 [Peribacillus frigoritolerans]|uniref:hypothetical protein n=1 Tax=Peribacillus frigoritolerans TaxID=450367 RepID=UPI003ECFCECE